MKDAKTGLTAADFKVLVDGTVVTPSAVVPDSTGANYTFTIASLDGKAGKVSINETEVDYDYAPAKVQSASAVNGVLTVKLNKTPDSIPAVTDFKIIQNINGTTKTINASSVTWNATTNTVTLGVPVISSTEVDQNVSYVVGYKETATQTSASFAVAKVTELKVVSAQALSSTQIQVVYNQEMDKDSVEDLTAYKLTKTPIVPIFNAFDALGGSKAVLQADKKTVIITLGTAESATGELITPGYLTNNTASAIQVLAAKVKSATGKTLEADVNPADGTPDNIAKTIEIADTTGPVVEKVAVNEIGDLEITFNEKLDVTGLNTPKVTVNGFTYGTASVAYSFDVKTGKSMVTVAKADLISTVKSKLESGKSYSVAVENEGDVYANKMASVFSSSFTYTSTAVAPTVTSVTAVDESSFIIKFSEDLTAAPILQVNKGAQQLITGVTTTAFTGRQTGEYKLILANADLNTDVLYDRAKNETSVNLTVYVPSVKDAALNISAATTQSVTLQKDVVKPAVASSIDTGSALTVKLTEAPIAVTDVNLAAGSYVLTESGRQIATTQATFTDALIGGIDKEFTFTNTSLLLPEGNYTLVIKKDTLTDQSLNSGNKNDELRIPFVVGAGAEVKPTVTAVDATTTPGDVKVTFANPVSYASAANYANYKLDDVTIPSDSTFILDNTGKSLTITLPEATYKESKDRVLTVNGVRSLSGVLMDQYQTVAPIDENEKIKLQSAKMVDGYILLTFNEDVRTTTLTTPITTTDLGIKVQGTLVNASAVSDATSVADVTKVANNQIKVTAPADASFATGTITIEALNDNTLPKDAAGNTIVLDGTVLTVTR